MAPNAPVDCSMDASTKVYSITTVAMKPPRSQGFSQPSIFLDPSRTPREIRDLIYDIIVDREYLKCWAKSAGNNSWELRVDPEQPQRLWFNLHYNRGELYAMLALCKQVREELLECLFRKTEFLANINRWERKTIDTFIPLSFSDWGRMRVLELDLWLETAWSDEYKAGAKTFLKDPFSVRYSTANELFPNTRLIRSDSSLTPTAYFDLKRHGFYSDIQLPALLEAEARPHYFPTIHNSDTCSHLCNMLRSLSAGGNLKEFRLRLSLPFLDRWNSPTIDWPSGMNEFMRQFAVLQGQDNVEISVTTNMLHRSTYAAEVENLLQQDVERVNSLLRSAREGCNLDPAVVCDCLTCFPPLHNKDTEKQSLDVEPFEQDNTDVQERIVEVEREKLRFNETPEDGEGWMPYWMDTCDLNDAEGYNGIQIGQPEGYKTYFYRQWGFDILPEHHTGCRP